MKFWALLLLFTFNLFADEYLLKEMIALKESIKTTDPEYSELTRRLADVYFDLSIQEGGSDEYRKEALNYYNDHLNGLNNIAKVEGEKRINILFQTARLNEKLGNSKIASKIYHEVYDNSDFDQDLKRQTALHLAEYYEEEAIYTKAKPFYEASIDLCTSVAVCNYAHYRMAWLLYKDVKLDEAIAELKLSLWHADGTIREKVLQDYFLFSSQRVTEGDDELAFVKELVKKTKDQTLVRTLVESFYSSGNRIAGSNVLEYMNSQSPDLYYELRLLEEFYGFRNWEKINYYLGEISKRTVKDLPKDQEEAKIAQTTIRRFIVQIDAEVERDKSYNPTLLQSIDIYLALYPNDELRSKMQQGWLKAQADENKKLTRLNRWIKEDIGFGKEAKWIHKMRLTRLSLAQKLKGDKKNEQYSQIILAESKALAELSTDTKDKRKFNYIYARELYGLEKFQAALPMFEALADLSITVADKWSILSQNLVLDIHNKNKDFSKIIAQTSKWSENLADTKDKKLIKELSEQKKIQNQARFEYAVSLGEKPEALEIFFGFCMNKTFEEKACTNAKVLSNKLADQTKYITLLEKEQDYDALIIEYELMGEYAKSAKLLEKRLKKSSALEDYFKLALLYELDMELKDRDRILNKLLSKVKSAKSIESKFEPLLFATLDEANLLDMKALNLPWSLGTKLKLVRRLELESPNKKTKSIIIAQKESTGPLWSRIALKEVMSLDVKQAKIKFYGRSSKWLFKKRTRALEKLNTKANHYLPGADSETRIYLIDILKNAYAKMEQDILNTPLPEGLTEDILVQVKAKLTEMAAPFEKVKSDYSRLMDEEFKAITDKAKLSVIQTNISEENKDYVSFINLAMPEERFHTAMLNKASIENLKADLRVQPQSAAILKSLEEYYTNNNSKRLASYYAGRLKNLKE